MDFIAYVIDMAVASVLIALAVSIYLDGIGYTVFHPLGIAALGAYTYATLTSLYTVPKLPAVLVSLIGAMITGSLCADLVSNLRADGLTLATFGLGIGTFEVCRFLRITGGVLGFGRIPGLSSGTSLSRLTVAAVFMGCAAFLVYIWRSSLGGSIVTAIRNDEWAAVSMGVSVRAHQRLTGVLAGLLAGAGGIYFASSTGFIEPRDFRPTNLLVPFAGAILARGHTPFLVTILILSIVLLSQTGRFVTDSAAVAGPVAEILVAALILGALVITRLYKTNILPQ
jgi:branched-chain amino acid transport system permease protein